MASAAFLGHVLRSTFRVTRRRAKHGPLRPSWSWSFEVVADALKKRAAEIAALDAEGQRRAWATMRGPSPIFAKVRRRDDTLAGLRCAWFESKQGSSGPTILYLHGGSYVYGSIESHAELCARIAVATGAKLVSVEYRLAPEHAFPAQLEDALRAAQALEGPIVLAGDSAGGGLAVSTAIALRDEPPSRAPVRCAGLILVSPWVDLTASGGSMRDNAPFDYAEEEDFGRWTDWFLGKTSPRDPRVSPTFARLDGLPPTQIFLGSAEMLLDQVTAFARKLESAGVRVELHVQPDMIHNGPIFASMFARCRPPFDAMRTFVAKLR